MMNDVFAGNAFTLQTLSEAINKAPIKPSRVAAMGLFAEKGVPTTSVNIEEKNGVLGLLSTKPRGAPGQTTQAQKRKMRTFAIPHIPVEETVRAEDIQNVRLFGSDNQLAAIEDVVNDKLIEIAQSMETTWEWQRLGALKGIVYDADNSTVIYNWFTEFNIGAPADVDFVLGTATTDIKAKCLDVKRRTEDGLQGVPYDHVHAFCGSDFFDRFTSHANVLQSFLYTQEASQIRNDQRAGFKFADIIFEEYRATVGGIPFVAPNECRFFPVGAPQVFRTFFGPADFMETVNTIGLPMYAKQEPLEFNRGRKIHAQSNPLHVCMRPLALRRGYSSN